MPGEEPRAAENTISDGAFYGPVLQGGTINASFQSAPAPAPVALAQLPPEAAGFTGRDDELEMLAQLLDPANIAGPVLVSAVAGLAGVGKTALAVAAGHAARRRGWYPGGVLFINLHGYDERLVEPGQALDALLRALGVRGEHIPPDVEARGALYRSVLAPIKEPVLVILDNASSEAQVEPLLPGIGPHKVLVTSRHTLAGLEARLVDVTVLGENAAVDVLNAALDLARPGDDRINSDRDAARKLARMCGGLPLALQIVAAMLKADPERSVDDLAQSLGVERVRLDRLRYDDGSGAGAPSVAAAFGLSYRRLDEVSARVFRMLPVNPGPDVSTAAAATLADLTVSQTREVLAGLARSHLIEAAPDTVARWRMHDLLHLYAQRLSDDHADADGREYARDRLLSFYLTTADAAGHWLQALPGGTVPGNFTDKYQALAWLDAQRPSLVAAVKMAADTGRNQVALELPIVLTEYFRWRRRLDDWLSTLTISLNAARILGDRAHEGTTLSTLGVALREMRRFEDAIAACRDATTLFREIGDRQREGIALTNLGAALQGVRRFVEAIAACRDARTLFREIGDRQREGIALTNLGAALREVRRFEEAIVAHQADLAICRETGDRHREGNALNNLGVALREVRRFEEAIAAHQDAAAIYRETGDRHRAGNALNNLGLALREVGRLDEAIAAHQEAAAIYAETGDRHRESSALTGLGVALADVRRLEEAIAAHREALVICGETGYKYGEGNAWDNLGLALREVGRLDEAIAAHQEAAAIYQETGDRHREGIALNNLGHVLLEAGQLENAVAAHRDATTIFWETADRHRQGITLNNLGVALREMQRFEEAGIVHQEAADIFRETDDRNREHIARENMRRAQAAQLECN